MSRALPFFGLLILLGCRTDKPGGSDSATAGPAPADADGDGYAADVDCDDANADVNPDAAETCNGIDDDCDGVTDEDDAADALTWFEDADADGYGDPASTTTACEEPSGFTDDDSDCDDADADVNPGAAETCNGIDDDCDGDVDEGFTADCDDLSCTGTGLIHTVSDGCMDDGGGSSVGDSLLVYCIDGIARFCLSGESCKYDPAPSTDDGTTCDRSGLGSDYMADAWCDQWNGHANYYCDSSGQIYFP